MFGDISDCHNWQGVLLASGENRPEILLTSFKAQELPLQQIIIRFKTSIFLLLRNLAIWAHLYYQSTSVVKSSLEGKGNSVKEKSRSLGNLTETQELLHLSDGSGII